ncbi:Protein TASOR [Bagarius yarrelli]|uniref:Protein TASOR n=1 Tax=Bagarius yarrelli TaxID=175774 RepID=A0A556UG63_BAGYA|nr:Protein TASOR [Bagarius yarrelli]
MDSATTSIIWVSSVFAGLLEPVLPGSVTFESTILAPLCNSYLYEESKESFSYNSAQLIKNAALQTRYSAFRAEKLKQGYSEEELEESFGFLLLDDKSRANGLADTGLTVGQGTCTTLGDCSKGVYISKYSDCLDLKRWYDGKTGYIVLLKLTKGRIKEVAENYTENFTTPTAGFDCHVSEQLQAACATTSSFLAFERTQYYMYELVDGADTVEPCPRHVCPFAIVAFSYEKNSLPLELKEKSPKTIKVEHAIGVSELRRSLPQAVFETSSFGEVSFDGKWFSMYDVISFETGNDLAFLTQELKEKDMALVIRLEDSGFLVLLHPSNFLSYEENKSIFHVTKVSSEVLQVLPALNYAESEMEKGSPKQNEEPLVILEKHLQNFAALIFPGLTSSPSRDSSMFPDQYDVPHGFPLISPKWTEQMGNRLRTYLKSQLSFQIPVSRAMELLAAGKQQRSDDQDDDVYYYISSPEAPQTPAYLPMERDLLNEIDQLPCRNVSEDVKKTVAAEPCALIEEINRPGAALVAVSDNNGAERTDTSPASGDLPTTHYLQNIDAVTAQDNKKTSECFSTDNECSGEKLSRAFSTKTIQTTIIFSSSDSGNDTSTLTSNAEMEVDEADLPTSISPPTTSVNRTEALTKGCTDVQPKAISNVEGKMSVPNRRGKRRRRRKTLKRKTSQITNSFQNTTLPSCPFTGATSECDSSIDAIHTSPNTLKKDWRSLPRHKKDWNADVNIKRSLRSVAKNTEMPCVTNDKAEKTTTITGPTNTKNMSGTAKRKMEGINMRERYGLKTIVTDCGFVFVPHGSEVAPGDIRSHENQQASVTTNSPVGEKPETSPTHDKPKLSEIENTSQHKLQTHISTNTALLSGDVTEKNSEQTSVSESTEKNKNTSKLHVYKAISISKLKTVLKRARKAKSSNAQGYGASISDTAEPKLKRSKPNNIELSDHCKQGNTEIQEPALRIPKEDGCNNFEDLSAKEMVKQAEQQLMSKPVGKRVEGKCSEGQRNKDKVADGVPAPSDALNLLADLALSVNGDKMLHDLRENHLEAKTTGSTQTVINLLRDLAPKLKLPAKSPFPEGLVVTGDLILEISKEHSYSQPTSPLAGICPQDQPLVECVESRLSMKSNLLLKLPQLTDHPDFHKKGGKNGCKFLPSLSGAPAAVKTHVWRSLFLSCRSIVEKGDSIQVTRRWKENYDFKFDSKFTNDRLDKCVTRALHGKWDFRHEDSYEQVHLIFHMWIGLFYSKPTSRLFHFDQICPSEARKNPEKTLHCAVKNSTPLPDVDLTSTEDKHTSVDPVSDALDLSVKEPETEDYCTIEKNPTPSPKTQSKVKYQREDKMPANEPNLAYIPTVAAEGVPMDYRSTVEPLDENSASDYNDYSDTEDDTTKVEEGSYTQVLENNSAYGQLCGLASNIKIDDQKLLNEKNNERVCKDLSMSITTNINTAGKMNTGLKDAPVFHQVVGSAEPVHSKMHSLLPRKKIILKSMSLKDSHKDEALVTVHSETASKDEAQVNEENHESRSVCVNSGKNDESAAEIITGTCSVISVPVNDENDASVGVIHGENSSEEMKYVPAANNNMVLFTNIGDAPLDGLDMSNQAKQQEVESVLDETPKDVKNYIMEMNVNYEATEKVGPVPEVRDEIPIDKPDVNHETDENIGLLCHAGVKT